MFFCNQCNPLIESRVLLSSTIPNPWSVDQMLFGKNSTEMQSGIESAALFIPVFTLASRRVYTYCLKWCGRLFNFYPVSRRIYALLQQTTVISISACSIIAHQKGERLVSLGVGRHVSDSIMWHIQPH